MISPYHYECTACDRADVDERFETVWTQVLGWEKKRDQGGTNHLAMRRPQHRFMCDACMQRTLKGVHPQQESLLAL